MNRIILIVITVLGFVFSAKAQGKEFDEVVLESNFVTLKGEEITFAEILKKNYKKTTVIDIWASWCSDCVKGIPTVKEMQKQFDKEVAFVFISFDKSDKSWFEAIAKYKLNGDHYFSKIPWKKSEFAKNIDLDWIPRYIVISKTGKIKLFKATNLKDEKVLEAVVKDLKFKK